MILVCIACNSVNCVVRITGTGKLMAFCMDKEPDFNRFEKK